MEQENTLHKDMQKIRLKEVAVKISLFIFTLYFFTFIGSGIFNQIFIETTIRIIVFLAFYMIIGSVLGTIPSVYKYFKLKRDTEPVEENAISIKWLLIHVLIGMLSSGLLCFLVIIVPYLCQFSQTARTIISRVSFYGVFTFITIFFCRVEKRPLISLGFQREKIILQILIGVGLGILTCLIFTLLPIMCRIVPAQNWVSKPSDSFQIIFAILSNILLIGTVEELVFRGYIQTNLKNNIQRKFIAIIITAFMFGVLHIFNGNVINMGMTFLIGLIFGFSRAYLKNCSLPSVMLAHALNNILIMVVALIYL